MIVPDPVPATPRRAAPRPDAADGAKAGAAGAFDALVAEPDTDETPVAMPDAAVPTDAAALLAAPVPTPAAPVPPTPPAGGAPAAPAAAGTMAIAAPAAPDAATGAIAALATAGAPGAEAAASAATSGDAGAALPVSVDAGQPKAEAPAPATLADPTPKASAATPDASARADAAAQPVAAAAPVAAREATAAAPDAGPDGAPPPANEAREETGRIGLERLATAPGPALEPKALAGADSVAAATGLDPAVAQAPQAATPAAAQRVAEAVARATADPQAVTSQVALAVAKSDDQRIEIRLDPPELGRVHIHLSPTDGGVQAMVVAQRPETYDLLRRHAELLAQELSDAGYGDVSLEFATGGEATGGEAARGEAAAGDGRPAPAWHALAAAPEAAAPRALLGALDIRL